MSLLDPADRSARGAAIGGQVTGAPLPAPVTPYQESWRDFIFAEVWSREGLDRRARYLVAIAGSSLTNGAAEHLDGYVRGALTGGELSLSELREAALHLSVYGGWTKGAELDRAVTRVAADLGLAEPAHPPIRAGAWDPAVRSEEGAAEFIHVMTFPGGPPATPYLEAIRNFVFGEMWCRPGLDQRSRRWLTLVGVCESAAETPIKSHIHAAMASGNCQPDEMQEFVLAYGIHAGWPKASVIQGVVFEMSKKFAAGLPWNG
ncbi:carboxymuconolactone decarboxylase family protein [Sphingobium sufflavum]|uniref:carboxymuconolactone decarboxylase family protein n=1 Tax=Sphingobium sufflavum TaxID=1129547 RepID=UPI001F317460|nr:carboxymuconolactone decarboxylase family protein [Sphingobium sufflavum]MCE7796236.1 carboxymuconolactone decarboxylase family protein [Sphingobium sufflavum]